jgi:dihydroorotase
MTSTFINARLIDPESGSESLGSLTVNAGLITARDAAPTGEIIDCDGQYLAPGIIDIGVKIGEPGERHKESFRTAGLAAAAGGVTTMVTRPDTSPPIDTPELLDFFRNRARDLCAVHVLPMAALTKGRAGREMTELGFLADAGAVAFTDGDAPVVDTKVLTRAMIYAAADGALIIGHAQDPILSAGAAATSGPLASKMGLPAVSAMAERLRLDHDLTLVEMTGARYHIDQITTAAALPALLRARKAGLKVTAGISVHHLTLNEFDIEGYRSFFKFKPPLRAESDRVAMVTALAEGAIDIICSLHTPQDEESKRLPFEAAASGAVGLETLLSAALQLVHADHITLPALFAALALNPARLLGLPAGRLSIGAPADLVLFNPNTPFILDRSNLQSKSKNTPYDGRRMQGRVLGTWVAGRRVWGQK